MRKTPKLAKILLTCVSVLLLCSTAAGLASCLRKVSASDDLMEGISAAAVTGKAADERFIGSGMELAVGLFKECYAESENGQVLVSPYSVRLALAMTANGACGKTRTEMEKLLGGDITAEELNAYLLEYAKSLPSKDKSRLRTANSIWFRDDKSRLEINKDFLQTNADYYGAHAYRAPFDEGTLEDVNKWVKKNTDGMIPKILEEIRADDVMYLINALAFDAEWESIYESDHINDGTFTSLAGETQEAEMMSSTEYRYFTACGAQGFIKNYKGGDYSFVGILPDEGTPFDKFVSSIDAAELLGAMKEPKQVSVSVTMPKFSYSYGTSLKNELTKMGMVTAFSETDADFSLIGKSPAGMYVGDVIHKTFIAVDEKGTKAGAATAVVIRNKSAMYNELTITLDRPFIYMIVDNATCLPVFIGAVTGLGQNG